MKLSPGSNLKEVALPRAWFAAIWTIAILACLASNIFANHQAAIDTSPTHDRPALEKILRLGDSQGIISDVKSATVAVQLWAQITRHSTGSLFTAHFLLWIVGLLALHLACKKVDNAILQREKAERHLEEANRDLENKVAARTAEHEEANNQLHGEITKRLATQEKLEYSINQWRETFDCMNDFVSVHDNEMRIARANKTLADFFGKTPQDLIGKHCYEVIHNTKEPWPGCPHLKAIEKKQTITEEIEEPYLKKTLLVTCSPIFNTNGAVTGTVHVARDITNKKFEEKEKEELLKKLQTSLDEIKTLRGILPFCSFCKKIRDDKGYWERVDVYIHKYSEADISHSICPECMKEHYPEEYQALYTTQK